MRYFQGDYSSWQEAVGSAEGYDADIILATQLRAARQVRDGVATYERDSVLFDRIEFFFPMLAALLYVASRNGGKLNVLDFGGALGSSYFQNRGFLSHLPNLKWCVIEQPHFVIAGRAEFENEHLKFFSSIEECFSRFPPDVIFLSSVLQYLHAPFDLLVEIANRKAPFILIDRTPVMDHGRERIVVQTVPPSIYPANYACRLFEPGALENALARDYVERFAFDAHVGTIIPVEGGCARYQGYFWERRDLEVS